MASSELISEADLSNVDFDTLSIPVIEEEAIFTHMQDDCAKVGTTCAYTCSWEISCCRVP